MRFTTPLLPLLPLTAVLASPAAPPAAAADSLSALRMRAADAHPMPAPASDMYKRATKKPKSGSKGGNSTDEQSAGTLAMGASGALGWARLVEAVGVVVIVGGVVATL